MSNDVEEGVNGEMNFSQEEVAEYIKGEVKGLPCFQCPSGMLELVHVDFKELVRIDASCQECRSTSKYELRL